jgi:lysozyme family protein
MKKNFDHCLDMLLEHEGGFVNHPKDPGGMTTEYWDKARCDDLPSGLDWAVFDWGVNSGMGRPAKALQRIVGVNPDGAIGPKTVKAIFDFDAKDMVEKLYDARQRFYESLKTFETFGRGWSRRNDETLKQAQELIENRG